eukprot:4692951-Alexandrium_andersonii.AAC.1
MAADRVDSSAPAAGAASPCAGVPAEVAVPASCQPAVVATTPAEVPSAEAAAPTPCPLEVPETPC